jgi:hypothetical protein
MIINVNKCTSKRVSTEHENENENENATLLSCNNITEHYLNVNLTIKNKKSYEKISTNDFVIPALKDYSNIVKYNYNVSQLRAISKHYKLSTGGNKEYLRKRLFNFLYYSYNIIIVQKYVRYFLTKKYIKVHGPAFYNRSLCSNDVDFCTLDSLNNISYNQFISFKDSNSHIYGFDIKSLYNLFIKSGNAKKASNNNNSNSSNVQNPFTNVCFSHSIFEQLLEYIRLTKLLKLELDLNYDELIILSIHKQLEMKILTLFQRIDSLGNYTNIKWFMELDKYGLIQFIRELADIWNYRANLTQETKRAIVPPSGNLFNSEHINININSLPQYNFIQIKKYAIQIIDLLINKGINENSCVLGSYYVLSALTMVSNEAAISLPWLYEAVNLNY